MSTDARDISRMLAACMPALAAQLLPGGRRSGHEWVAARRSQGGPGDALSVHLTGSKAGIWANFASGAGGDALDLVAALCCAGDIGAALAWSRRWLGLDSGPLPARTAATPPPSPPDDAVHADAERRRRAALALFLEAAPLTPGDPVERYLDGRGVALQRLGRAPSALRCHPRLWCAEAGRHFPAMVAAVCDAAGAHVATHRTWLQPQAGAGMAWRKAPLQTPKKLLGAARGGSIRLWRGASLRPLSRAPEGDVVAIAEGIETALSLALAVPELRVLACVSLGNMALVDLPYTVSGVVLCADNDAGNAVAAAALERAVERYKVEGRAVRVAMPQDPGADWNDVMVRRAIEGVAA